MTTKVHTDHTLHYYLYI